MYQLPAVHRGIAERLICLHDEIKGENTLASLSRIAVALYDDTSDMVKTFIHSSDGESPVDGASAPWRNPIRSSNWPRPGRGGSSTT